MGIDSQATVFNGGTLHMLGFDTPFGNFNGYPRFVNAVFRFFVC